MFMTAKTRREVGQQMVLRTYGLVFLVVIALLIGLSVAIYNKAFIDVVHVTLETNRVGNQLAPPADVKLRGMIVGEVRKVRSDGVKATIDLALTPSTVGLIPSNVTARLLPKTLFGEKFVDLQLPGQPTPQRLGEGDVITQDRSSTAIELERVLDNLLPLLRTINPAKLNATLNAFATALEGRGDQLGNNLELVNQYFTRLNPELPTIQRDLVGLADVSELYADVAPDLVRMLRNFSVTTRTIAAKQEAYAGFLAGTAGFATTTRAFLQDNESRLIQVAAVGRPTLELLAKYSPEYPCLLAGLAESERNIGKAFANGELHITLEVIQARKAYLPGEEPQYNERRGPNCYSLPRPAVPRGAYRFDDGTNGGGGTAGRAVPGFLADPSAGRAGTAEEQQVVNPLVAPLMGRPASDVPDLATLLFGPMARGTAVGQS
ncbi:MAG: phospholipid/cholesterol/gamma-HCH transport system substrate-binding protein [Actinomycetota bacterium]|jgi:virulence factor Mce-like protein|nr:phospholipid/cholesterol/gamma-HCH transport system substrate-binding protein [Actinomycetota bacterium]